MSSTSQKISRRANNLDGKTWLKYSISIWDDIKKSPEEIKLNHPAMFPAELCRRLISIFTSDSQKVVLDPFMGSGSTLVAAKHLEKTGIGFEIAKEYVEMAKKRLAAVMPLYAENNNVKIIEDDARAMLEYLEVSSVDLCITSPPYWDILSQKRSADQKKIRDYEKADGNLGDINNYDDFLGELKAIFKDVYYVLAPGSYCIMIVMDIRKKSKYYSFHSDIIKFMEELKFILDDIIIWNRKSEYNNLRPLGYPYVFRINKIHEFVLIFKKRF